MIVSVTKNKITIDKGHTANQGEYNIRDCIFLFSEEYTQELVKVAVFSKDGKAYKVGIVNNECVIPYEVLETKGTIKVGVYAYSIEEQNGEELLKQRYSPAPAEIFMDYGSYIEDAENAGHPTPTEIEQLEARIEAVEIDAQQVETNTQDIATLKTTKAGKDEIPTKTSQLTNDNGFIDNSVNNLVNYTLTTETGSKIDLEINSSTYVLTAKLSDKNNNVISTSSNIDLPIESMIINATYNSETKKIILTLQNGNTLEVSIADLISGLQPEITSQNKLSSDLVDDTNKTNKFVTTSEKNTWNAKLDGSKVKTATSTTSGDVYDVTYINTMVGDLESILEELDIGGGI